MNNKNKKITKNNIIFYYLIKYIKNYYLNIFIFIK